MSRGLMANSMLNAAAGLTMLVTGFISAIIAARLLGPEANGIIAFAFWLSTTATLVAGLGADVILPRRLAQLRAEGYDERARRGFGAYFARGVIVAMLALLGLYALSCYENEQYRWAAADDHVLAITGLLFLAQSLGMLSIHFMIGEKRVATFYKLTLVSSALQLSIVSIGALSYGIAGALAGYVAGQGVFFVYALKLFAVRANPCGTNAASLARTSAIISVQLVIESIFLNRIELLFLQQFDSVAVVGFYAIGLSLANLALQLPVQLTGTLVPYYTEQAQARPDGRLPVHLFENVIRTLAYFTLPMGFGLAAISWEMVTEVYGETFAPAGNIVALLALSAPLSVFLQIATKYLFAIGRERERLKIGIIGAALMVAGCFAAVPLAGGEGAAATRIAVLLVMSLLTVSRMEFEGSMRPMFLSLARITLASMACAAAAYTIANAIDGLIGILAAILGGAAVYIPALRLLRAIPASDVAMIEPLLNRLPGRLRQPGKQFLTLIANPGAI